MWNGNDITIGKPHTSYLENSWDKSKLKFLKTNSIRNLHMLWKYLHHLVRKTKESCTPGDPFSFMLPDQFCNLRWREFMSWRLEDSNQSASSIPSKGHRGYTQEDSRHESDQNAYQLLVFKKSIKREVSQCTILNDEKYFEAFERNPLVTATTHDCEEIQDGNYKPENKNDSKELFKQKKYFMYSVFNKVLQSDIGKTILRNMHYLWMHNQYKDILNLTCPPHLIDSMKGIDCMHMYPQLLMISHRKTLLNNLFSTSVNNLDNLMKSHHRRNICPTLSD